MSPVDGVPAAFGDANSPALPLTGTNPSYVTPVSGGVKLLPRAFLAGAYNETNGLMSDALRVANIIPTAQPYNTADYMSDFAYTGAETVASTVLATIGNNAIVDWVIVELRSAADPKVIVTTRAALIQRDGDIVDTDGVSAVTFTSAMPASYYITVRHRNHLGVMTQTAIPLSQTGTTVDFTLPSTANYKLSGLSASDYAQQPIGTKRTMWAGNTEAETPVNYNIIYQGPQNDISPINFDVLTASNNPVSNSNYILNGYLRTDVNMDGKVIYQGPNNEVDITFFEVLTHLLNPNYLANYIIVEQIPR
jgi:hypothetical protein